MYDAIVVGARCAGSTTARLLAQDGLDVLLVDRVSFPSDTISTHIVWQSGMDRLARWGLADRVAATGCPPIRTLEFNPGPFQLVGPAPATDHSDAAYCCRRTVLDALLVDAAAEAGVEVRQDESVKDLLFEDDAVVGIRTASGTERARIVIGADGLHSTVANLVGAPTYEEIPTLTNCYYSYWSGVDNDRGIFCPRDGYTFGWVPTNDGLTTVIAVTKHDDLAFRDNLEKSFFATFDEVPSMGERLRAGTREERFHGTGDLPNFFRRPWGAGWALVGDAGYHKDPIMAQGISDAFRDAELLAAAVHDGLAGTRPMDEALAGYEQQRNEATMPTYVLNSQFASQEPPPEPLVELLLSFVGNDAKTSEFFGLFTGSTSVPDFFAAMPHE